MDTKKLQRILDEHKKWLNHEDGGRCANLSGANLQGANLRGVNLFGATLRGADLSGADLVSANLCGADMTLAILIDADLRFADLKNADLCDADLREANLRECRLIQANLRDVDLRHADLRDADLRGAKELPDLSWTSIVPDTGSFIGWNKVDTTDNMVVIIKLEILADAKRCSGTGRKCRCSAAKVLEIQKVDGTPAGLDSVMNSDYMPRTPYTVGETVLPDGFDDDRYAAYGQGIYFFITRQEAVDC